LSYLGYTLLAFMDREIRPMKQLLVYLSLTVSEKKKGQSRDAHTCSNALA
jgi:hypothetical protein